MIPLQAADILAHCLRGEAVRKDPLSIDFDGSTSGLCYHLRSTMSLRTWFGEQVEATTSRKLYPVDSLDEFIGMIRREFGVPVEKLPIRMCDWVRGDLKI